MNFFHLFVLLNLFQNQLPADCSDRGISVSPDVEFVNQNTLFMIDAYGSDQWILMELNKRLPVYLCSGRDTIPLEVVEFNEDGYHINQSLLRPVTPLIPGKTYELCIDNLLYGERFSKYVNSYSPTPGRFTILEKTDTVAPAVTQWPVKKSSHYVALGCGPSIYVDFAFSASDSSEYYVKAFVRKEGTDQESAWYLYHDGKKVGIGHGMCSGAFRLEPKSKYEVRFEFMDMSGNLTRGDGSYISFTAPHDLKR